jgi:hypothetical protein
MTRPIGSTTSRALAIAAVVVVALAFAVWHLKSARQPVAPEVMPAPIPVTMVSGPYLNLKTSADGYLQQQVKAAYPESFREGVDIFFEPRDGWPSQEVFDWWVARVKPEGLTREGADEMFSRFSDESPIFPGSRKRRMCAVVGASRNLLGSGYGPLIDAHDLVFRVNRAPRGDFASDVGWRTTHHVAWPTNLSKENADRRAYLLWNPLTLHTPDLFDWMLSLVEKDLRWDPERVRIINPEFVKYLHESWMEERGSFPSTGLVAMMLAVHVCDEVDIFGFGADAQGRWDRYYEDDPKVPTDLHPADFEGELRSELEERGIIKVYLGNRSADGVEHPGFQEQEDESEAK